MTRVMGGKGSPPTCQVLLPGTFRCLQPDCELWSLPVSIAQCCVPSTDKAQHLRHDSDALYSRESRPWMGEPSSLGTRGRSTFERELEEGTRSGGMTMGQPAGFLGQGQVASWVGDRDWLTWRR